MPPTPALFLLGWSRPDPWHHSTAFHLFTWHPAHWQGLVPELTTSQCQTRKGFGEHLWCRCRQLCFHHRHCCLGCWGMGLFKHIGIGRISVILQQIWVLGVTKAFVHSSGFLSCSVTWWVVAEPQRVPGAAGQQAGGCWCQLCRWWPHPTSYQDPLPPQ